MKIVFELFLLLICMSAAVALFTYSFFWYENFGTPEEGLVKSSGRSLAALTLNGIVTGFASLLVVMFTYPFALLPNLRKPAQVAPSQPIIILTHGLYHNASAWLLMRHRLRKAGFTNIFLMNYFSFFTSFESVYARFEKFIAKSRAEAPGLPVILVGHSLGGLLSRLFAERASGDNIPSLLITLGTPHRGSKMVAFASGDLGKSIMYDGPLIREIEQEGRGIPCPAACLFSPADGLVLPSGSLRAPYPGWTEYQTEPVSHVWMLYSKEIASLVIDLIKR